MDFRSVHGRIRHSLLQQRFNFNVNKWNDIYSKQKKPNLGNNVKKWNYDESEVTENWYCEYINSVEKFELNLRVKKYKHTNLEISTTRKRRRKKKTQKVRETMVSLGKKTIIPQAFQKTLLGMDKSTRISHLTITNSRI